MLSRPSLDSASRLLGALLATALLLGVAGCSMPPALSKTELDSNKMPTKHPPVSAAKEKAGCRSCHREQEPVSAAE
jgi:hypothetical protein